MPNLESQLTDDENEFISNMPKDGSAIGNIKLRSILGWDKQKYLQVKKPLLKKGIIQRGTGMGGSVKISDVRKRKRWPEEQATIMQKQKSKLSKILLNSIPKDGKTYPNHIILQKVQKTAKAQINLEVSREMYFEIRNELITEGLVGKGVGYGGSVYRIEGAKKAGKESDLYESVRKYIENNWTAENEIKDFVLDKTAEQGGKKRQGIWTRPDFSLVAIQSYTYIPGRTIELITFEVKPADDFRIEGVFETAAHSRATHRSYLMIHTPDGRPDTDKFQRLVSECERFRLGLIIFADKDNWDTYEIVQDADHRNPNPGDVNSFIKTLMKKDSQEKIIAMVR